MINLIAHRIKNHIIAYTRGLRKFFRRGKNIENSCGDIREFLLWHTYEDRKSKSKNPIAKYGYKCFSQGDEDGITLEIINRIGLDTSATFCEFGVGDGTENNTLILAAAGWRGVWIGNDNLKIPGHLIGDRINYKKSWVTDKNILALANGSLSDLGKSEFDYVSLDFDGNDYYFVERLLDGGITPKIFVVEYNAHFPPPIKFVIKYDESHLYENDAYFGASLQSYSELFSKHNYTLICCNLLTGANAFFIRNDYKHLFEDVPTAIGDIYAQPSYFLPKLHGYPHTGKTYDVFLENR